MQFERLNPMTGEVASSAEAMQPGDIPAIAAKAQEGFATWSKMGPNARRAVLNKAADALMAKKDDFVAAMMGEIGATAGWAMFNLGLAAGMVREAAAITTQIQGEVIPSDHEGTVAMALREPVGVLLGAVGFLVRVALVSVLLGENLWVVITGAAAGIIDGLADRLQLPLSPDLTQVQLAALALVLAQNLIYVLALHAVAWWVFPRLRQSMPDPPPLLRPLLALESS